MANVDLLIPPIGPKLGSAGCNCGGPPSLSAPLAGDEGSSGRGSKAAKVAAVGGVLVLVGILLRRR